MSKPQPNMNISPVTPKPLPATPKGDDAASGTAFSSRADPLPWLIRSLRGRYDCGQAVSSGEDAAQNPEAGTEDGEAESDGS